MFEIVIGLNSNYEIFNRNHWDRLLQEVEDWGEVMGVLTFFFVFFFFL